MKGLILVVSILCLAVSESSSYYLKFDVDPADDAFLDDLERASFLFFWEQADPVTGLIKDRAFTNGSEDNRTQSSIASVGFGLTALAIGHKRNYMDRAKIEQRVVNTLDFIYNKLEGHNGFYYHFVDMNTGKRIWNSAISSIDNSYLIGGVMTVRAYFENNETIRKLSTQIYEGIDYEWMLNGGKYIAENWYPEYGFSEDSWDDYCELMMLLFQAMGSPTHPIPVDGWYSFERDTMDYKNITFISDGEPLFVNQFAHAWVDFYNNTDYFTDYFQNSVNATKVNKLWSITDLAKNFSIYSENYWGVTTSDSVNGYLEWGGPPTMGDIDGTVVPHAAGGSIPFLPKDTLAVLKNLKNTYPRSYGKYGFTDAFNPLINWYDDDVIGLDVGITMLMAENYRSGFVWEQFMKNPEIVKAMKMVGFKTDKPGWASSNATKTSYSLLLSLLSMLFIGLFK